MKKKFLYGINEKTYDILYGDYQLSEHQSSKKVRIFNTIDYFTKIENDFLINLDISKLKKFGLDKISYDDKTKLYRYYDGVNDFTFDKMSNHVTDEYLYKDLTTDRRYGECHLNSILLASQFKDSKIITGYVTIFGEKILHSIIELPNGDIIDWTKNLIINSDIYYKLTRFEKLSIINSNDVINDTSIYENLIDIKTYCTFRDEVTKDLEKNISMFK